MRSSSYVCPAVGSTGPHPHPSNGFCSTANDFSKFTQLMFRGGRKCSGGFALKSTSVKSILSPETRNANLIVGQMFTSSFARTRCVTNTVPGNASMIGYGFGAFHSWGFRRKVWFHPGAMGSMNWLDGGNYAALVSTSFYLTPSTDMEMRMFDAFEAENYPDEKLCPYPTIMLPMMVPAPPSDPVPWM
mmetsp:Transcript_57017/g.114403  ORF Transcript_57017/g.114403 Transcript_57017/m.114403 type:complete len:188 (-) Transcript_57017:63-626(-)